MSPLPVGWFVCPFCCRCGTSRVTSFNSGISITYEQSQYDGVGKTQPTLRCWKKGWKVTKEKESCKGSILLRCSNSIASWRMSAHCQKNLDFIDPCEWNIDVIMAHIKQPKDLLKAISSQDPREGDLARPGSTPVCFDVGDLDYSHVENDAKETLHLCGRYGIPIGVTRTRA